ncbi:MAG: hypothetical protein ACJ798_07420 [Phenylobacterium sp.]
MRPALDGLFAAFRTHPIVGLGDAHGLAEEGAFYRRLVRDPRFAAQVGNLVVEFASSAHQDTLDRYVAGEDVPRAELRWVWSDVVGGSITATALMYQELLAEVRAVNQHLPPARRIRVWAGEPAADWSAIRTPQDLEPYLEQRDASADAVIEREVLGRAKKAVVIYGALHFFHLPTPPGLPASSSLKARVERAHPGAVYVVIPYFGFVQPECSASFEAATRWPADSLVAPVTGTSLEALLTRPGCPVIRPPRPAPGAQPMAPEVLAQIQAGFVRPASGADADALLYLAPAASLTTSPNDPDLKTDPAYSAEMARRAPIIGFPPDFANHLATGPRPYRDRNTPPAPRATPNP